MGFDAVIPVIAGRTWVEDDPPLMCLNTEENAKLTDCYYEKKDWRQCKEEVCYQSVILSDLETYKTQMEMFKQCWKMQGNDKRTDSKDV